MRLFLTLTLMLIGALAGGQARAAESWVRLATSRVAPGASTHTIDTSRAAGVAKSIRLTVREGTLSIRRVTVAYGGATRSSSLWFSRTLRAGETSRPLVRLADARRIERVTLELKPPRERPATAVVEVWGLVVTGPDAKTASREELKELQRPGPPTRRHYYSKKRAARPARPEAREEAAPGADDRPVARYEYRVPKKADEPSGGSSPPEGGSGRSGGGNSGTGYAPGAPRDATPAAPRSRGLGGAASEAARPEAVTPDGRLAAPKVDQVPGAGSAQASDKPYAEVDVFFGTDRQRDADRIKFGRNVASFGSGRAHRLTLGKAVVTVPKEGRTKGSIPRPEWDLIVTRFSLRKEDLARDFTVFAVDVLSQDQFIAEARKKLQSSRTFKDQAFVFVHGYFVTFDDALFRAAQITYDLGFDGVPFVYSWPSVAGLTGYVLDRGRARDAREYLEDFMELVAAKTGAKEVHLIAHSMGADPLLEVLRDFSRRPEVAGGRRPAFGEIILAAPDVTRESFEQVAERIKPLRRGMTLFASSTDRAMQASRWTRLGESPAGYVPSEGPVVVPGLVDTIDVSSLDTSFFAVNHSTFADREQLIADIKALMTSSLRPPDRRLKAYEAVSGAAGTYWRFVPQ